ncbi:hypothetical protein TNCV_4231201 [Trichonephila clavipes]|uniref:Uncharacterized protein n=1 Tax=Trichonephila clavipes TaxID=2585209 RepID=A0A8X6SEC1_TRICX|nr:hypothetical protein TNCV_4231201 [Trichonephila clavipes]
MKKRGPKMSGIKNTLSGSQKRKIRKEKAYNINSKYAKLDNLLISASSSSCASANSSNARELDEQIMEVKMNPQEKTQLRTLQLIRILYLKKRSWKMKTKKQN